MSELPKRLALFVLEPLVGRVEAIPSGMDATRRGQLMLNAAVVISTSWWTAPDRSDGAEAEAMRLRMARRAADLIDSIVTQEGERLEAADIVRLQAASSALRSGWGAVSELLARSEGS